MKQRRLPVVVLLFALVLGAGFLASPGTAGAQQVPDKERPRAYDEDGELVDCTVAAKLASDLVGNLIECNGNVPLAAVLSYETNSWACWVSGVGEEAAFGIGNPLEIGEFKDPAGKDLARGGGARSAGLSLRIAIWRLCKFRATVLRSRWAIPISLWGISHPSQPLWICPTTWTKGTLIWRRIG